jgi:hypothetical protein
VRCICLTVRIQRRTWQDDSGVGLVAIRASPAASPRTTDTSPAGLALGLGSKGSNASSGFASLQRGLRGAPPAVELWKMLARPLPWMLGLKILWAPFVSDLVWSWELTFSLKVQRRGQAPPGHRAEARAGARRRGHRPAKQTSWELHSGTPHSSLTAPHLSSLSPLSFQIHQDGPLCPCRVLCAGPCLSSTATQRPAPFDQSANRSMQDCTVAII